MECGGVTFGDCAAELPSALDLPYLRTRNPINSFELAKDPPRLSTDSREWLTGAL